MHRRLLLLALAAFAPALGAQTLPAKFDPARDAEADVQLALTLAREQRKLVFVDLGGEWCSWCHVFDRFVAARPEVLRTLRERYILVKVNYSPRNPNPALLSRWPKAKGYPHFYVLDADGRVLASQPSAELEADNDYDEARMLAFLRRHVPAS
ncbi:MAG TPA: thioredoxin family protein [Ramlibacter sp.]|uniref:thioredoxin family protein n=1 Tax=Ramlibacter sp. TaxID=1917967 RepID=UPI002ED61E1E